MVSFTMPNFLDRHSITSWAAKSHSGRRVKITAQRPNTLLTAKLRHNGALDAVFSFRRAAIKFLRDASVVRKFARRSARRCRRAL